MAIKINPSVSSKKEPSKVEVFKTKKVMKDLKKESLYSEFYSLLSSGIDFNRAFTLLMEGENDNLAKVLLKGMYSDIIKGDTLATAFKKSGRFDPLDYGVIKIGEETGKLNDSLSFLAEYYRNKIKQKRMLSGAISYPLIIIITAIVVLIFMINVIVPMFEQVYTRMGGELPALTKAIIYLSNNFNKYLLAISIIVIPIFVALVLFKESNWVRKWKSSILLRIPIVGALLRKHYQSHFCKLMYLLNSSSIPLIYSLEMLEDIITFYPYQESFREINRGLNRGESFSENVSKYEKLYDSKLVVMLRVGEETNQLSNMLKNQADNLSAELEHKLKQLGSMLEPILILFVGVLVAVVLVSMYLPMFKLGGTIY